MNDRSNAPRCLLVSRAPTAGYPPTIYQAELLAEQGYAVTVADTGSTTEFRKATSNAAVAHQALFQGTASQSLRNRLRRMVTFRRAAYRLVRSLRPALTIAYDSEACAAVRDAPRRVGGLLAWHFHEMWEPGGASFATNIAIRYARRNIRLPHIVIVPDRDRADVLIAETDMPASRVFIVMNCPRVTPRGCSSAQSAPDFGRDADVKLVVYNGSVGPDHGLETAIESSMDWPNEARFVVKGRASAEYDQELARLAFECGVERKFQRAPFEPGFGEYARAAIGWTVLEPVSRNWSFSAGASNKRFECMAAGVPQITDDTPATRNLIDNVGCGLCISPHSRHEAAAAVNRLLSDDRLRAEMGQRGRQAHLGELNYESQFKPVVSYLEQRLRLG